MGFLNRENNSTTRYPDGSKVIFTTKKDGSILITRRGPQDEIGSSFRFPNGYSEVDWDRWIHLHSELKENQSKKNYKPFSYTERYETELTKIIPVPSDMKLIATKHAFGRAVLFRMLAKKFAGEKIRIALPSFEFITVLTSKNLIYGIFGENYEIEPVWVDIDPETFLMDEQDLLRTLSLSKPHAILSASMFDNVIDANGFREVAKQHNVSLFFDYAHGYGENYGDGSTFNFAFNKILSPGWYGKGGATVLPREQYDQLKEMGIFEKIRISDEEAIYYLANIHKFKDNIEKRKRLAELYRQNLRIIPGIKFQKVISSNPFGNTFFPILINESEFGLSREELQDQLARFRWSQNYPDAYIEAIPRFKPIHDPSLIKLPNTEYVWKKILTLPFTHEMSTDDINEICQAIIKIRDASIGGSGWVHQTKISDDKEIKKVTDLQRNKFTKDQWNVLKTMLPTGAISILEAGSGTGKNLIAWAKENINGSAIGVDKSYGALHNSKRAVELAGLTNVIIKEGNIDNLPIDNEVVDCVFSEGVLEHYRPAQIMQLLKEQLRTLKLGGKIIVSVPNYYSPSVILSFLYNGIDWRNVTKNDGYKKWRYGYEQPLKAKDVKNMLKSLNVNVIEQNGYTPFYAFYGLYKYNLQTENKIIPWFAPLLKLLATKLLDPLTNLIDSFTNRLISRHFGCEFVILGVKTD